MKTIKVKLYLFSELSDKAKQNALDSNRDISVEHDWWSYIYDDANDVYLKITSFCLDRNRNAKGEFARNAIDTANQIKLSHGENCETFKTASRFLVEYDELVGKHSDGVKTDVVDEGNEYDFDQEADELESEFLKSILEDYSIILQKEYEHLMSDEAVGETLQINEYDFTIDGKIYF